MDTPTNQMPPAGSSTGPGGSTRADPTGLRSLRRSTADRVLGGVAGGVAEHYRLPPVAVRLAFVATTFLGGIGAIAYLVAWVVVPSAPPADATPRPSDKRQLLGYGLVALGLLALPGQFGLRFGGGGFWPVALIGLGVAVLWLRTRDEATTSETGPSADRPTPGPAPTTTGALAIAAAPAAPPRPSSPDATVPPPTTPLAPPPSPSSPAPEPPPVVPSPPRARSPLGAIAVSALLVLAGVAWLLDVTGVVEPDLGVLVASALVLVGAVLVLSAWFGRARSLIALGIPLFLVVAALGVVDVPLQGGVGDPSYTPRSVTAVHTKYELAIGDLTVDLRDVDFAGHSRAVRASLGIGQLNVVVPDGVRVVLDGHAGVGRVTAFGDSTRQCCPTDVHQIRRGAPGGGTLRLVGEVGAGNVSIRSEESTRAPS